MLSIIGILGGLLFVMGDLPYARDTIRGRTKPHRTSWSIYVVINVINLFNQLASGATNSLWLIYASVVTTTVIFILSIKKGMGGFEKLDIVCLAGALFGLFLWAVSHNPVTSLISNLLATTIAVIPTYKKAYKYPQTETSITYLLCSIAGIFAAVSVGRWSLALLLLPLHDFVIEMAMYVLLVVRTKQLTPVLIDKK